MSTLVTERRRPPDNEAGQESLFGGEAFAAGPPAPTSWEREHAAAARRRRETPPDAGMHMPLEVDAPRSTGEAGARDVESPTASEAKAAAPVEDERAPFDESQYLTGYEASPSAEDLAAY